MAEANNNFFVDMHCHIDLYKDPASAIRSAERDHVYTIAVTNAPFVFENTAHLVATSRYVRAAAGLHPELVGSHGHQIDKLRPLLDRTRYVGEIGLDYTTLDESLREKQRHVFGKALEWCAEYSDKIVTLHSRRASADVISMVGSGFNGKAVLHWFSGTKKEVERAANFGFYFSVNPAMSQSKKGQSLIAAMPIERVLTESDGPLVGVGQNSQLHPADVKLAVQDISTLWRVSFDETRSRICENFRTIVGEGSTHFQGFPEEKDSQKAKFDPRKFDGQSR